MWSPLMEVELGRMRYEEMLRKAEAQRRWAGMSSQGQGVMARMMAWLGDLLIAAGLRLRRRYPRRMAHAS
ncbi:MAG: hypothetical protein Kow0047_05260 [Anaerolineae bacterium]